MLSPFISKYQKLVANGPLPEKYRRTRIAIIDNGIMSMSPATHDGKKNRSNSRASRRTAADEQAEMRGRSGSSRPTLSNHGRTRSKTPEASGADDMGFGVSSEDESQSETENDDSSQGDLSSKERRDKAKGQRTLWSRIKLGRSFVDNDHQLSPWLFASEPHGTQMANLICAIDPACELYVAKVTDGRDGITPHRVARASQPLICSSETLLTVLKYPGYRVGQSRKGGHYLYELCHARKGDHA